MGSSHVQICKVYSLVLSFWILWPVAGSLLAGITLFHSEDDQSACIHTHIVFIGYIHTVTTLDGSEFILTIQSFILQKLSHKNSAIISLSMQFSTFQPSQQPCKISSLEGEVLSIASGAVESCLGSGADRILFDALVEAALASEDLGFG